MQCVKFTSATFDPMRGILYTGCQTVKIWKARTEPEVELKAL